MIDDYIRHQAIVARDILDVLPVTEVFVYLLVVDNGKSVVAAPGKEWQNVHGIDVSSKVFVKKAPACTVADLATALKNLFKSDVPTNIIGMRHGEKLYETLVTKEELQRSQDMGDYYRVRLDDRNLNYAIYFTQGDQEEAEIEDYTSHNTQILNVKEVEELLLSLPKVTAEME